MPRSHTGDDDSAYTTCERAHSHCLKTTSIIRVHHLYESYMLQVQQIFCNVFETESTSKKKTFDKYICYTLGFNKF